MRYHETFKCKRQALGMSQKELAEMIDMSAATISRLENGEQLGEAVFNNIKYGFERYLATLDRETYLRFHIIWRVMQLGYDSDVERLLTLQNISLNCSKLSMEITKRLFREQNMEEES